MIDFARDLAAILGGDFACVASREDAPDITGIFDNGQVETDFNGGRESLRAECVFTTASENGVVEGELLTIADVVYRVATPADDGTGVVRCYLERR